MLLPAKSICFLDNLHWQQSHILLSAYCRLVYIGGCMAQRFSLRGPRFEAQSSWFFLMNFWAQSSLPTILLVVGQVLLYRITDTCLRKQANISQEIFYWTPTNIFYVHVVIKSSVWRHRSGMKSLPRDFQFPNWIIRNVTHRQNSLGARFLAKPLRGLKSFCTDTVKPLQAKALGTKGLGDSARV